jgi:ABC-type phosphate transport system auxiliary subunit
MQTDKSILDSLTDDVKDLERGLGARDLGRLHEYLEHVREVERRIQLSEKAGAKSLQDVDAPFGIPEAWEEHARLMFELAALAYQADITRVLSYMMAKDAT